jgi:hypothetical protein
MNQQLRQWKSSIPISVDSNRYFQWWDEDIHTSSEHWRPDDSTVRTVQIKDEYEDQLVFQTGLVYSTGVSDHKDCHLPPYSALMILSNTGFKIIQSGLSSNQTAGTIILLNLHEIHALEKIKEHADKWAAIYFDYHYELDRIEIEHKLQKTYNRIFSKK